MGIYGIFLIMRNAGFIPSSAVSPHGPYAPQKPGSLFMKAPALVRLVGFVSIPHPYCCTCQVHHSSLKLIISMDTLPRNAKPKPKTPTQTLSLKPESSNPNPESLNRTPKSLNPKPLNPKPQPLPCLGALQLAGVAEGPASGAFRHGQEHARSLFDFG